MTRDRALICCNDTLGSRVVVPRTLEDPPDAAKAVHSRVAGDLYLDLHYYMALATIAFLHVYKLFDTKICEDS